MTMASSAIAPDPQLGPQVGGPRYRGPLPRVGPVRGTALLASAGVAVGAGDGVVPDDPPDPGRPRARRTRADGAGRPRRRPAGVARAERPALAAVPRLPPRPLHRGPRDLPRLAAPGQRRDRAAAARHALPGGAGVPGGRARRRPGRRHDGRAHAARPRATHRAGLHDHERRARHHPRLPARSRARLRVRRQPRLAPGRRQRQPRRLRAARPRARDRARRRSWPGSSGSRWSR